MARKAPHSSYPEKLIYDNTVFRGIVATSDANTEGCFRSMVNFDISETGQSVKPREGLAQYIFVNTYGDPINLNIEHTVYFQSATTGLTYFVDFSKINNRSLPSFNTDMEPIVKDIPVETAGTSITASSGEEIVYVGKLTDEQIKTLTPVGDHKGIYLKDLIGLERYVVRCTYETNPDSTSSARKSIYVELSPNTQNGDVLITITNTDDFVSYNDRNMASGEPLFESTRYQTIGASSINQFPIQVIEDPNHYYYTSRISSMQTKTLIPIFQLIGSAEGKDYYYTYDIRSTGSSSYSDKSEDRVYQAPIFRLSDQEPIPYVRTLMKDQIEDNFDVFPGTGSTYGRLHNSDDTIVKDYETAHDMSRLIDNIDYVLCVFPTRQQYEDVEISNTALNAFNRLFRNTATASDERYQYFPTLAYTSKPLEKYTSFFEDPSKLPHTHEELIKSVASASRFESPLFDCEFMLIPVAEMSKSFMDNGVINNSFETVLFSPVQIFPKEKVLTNADIYNELEPLVKNGAKIYIRYFYSNIEINYTETSTTTLSEWYKKYLPTSGKYNVVSQYLSKESIDQDVVNTVGSDKVFNLYADTNNDDSSSGSSKNHIYPIVKENKQDSDELFLRTSGSNSYLYAPLDHGDVITTLQAKRFFDIGIQLTFYIINTDALDMLKNTPLSHVSREYLVASTSIYNDLLTVIDTQSPVYGITNILTEEPAAIANADGYTSFYSDQGYRLVTWKDNKVYMSEASQYNYFKEENIRTYPEKVYNVIEYQDKLFVFTAQNMYTIFPSEVTETVETGEVDDNGNKKTTQVTTIRYLSLPVLYNLNPDPQKIKATKVYNNTVLFYSDEGILYLITPTAQIDTNTAFTMKFINKSAMDILAHYTDYINARLMQVYKMEMINEKEVEISSDINVNYIDIIFNVPSREYTFIVRYDIASNRYTIIDTLAYADEHGLINTPLGPFHICSTLNGMVCGVGLNINKDTGDILTLDGFNYDEKEICCELETGNLYLNNQWKKRFRDLKTTYKNIGASKIKYDLDVFVDDVPIVTQLSPTLELLDIGSVMVPHYIENSVTLDGGNSALFDFDDFHANKLIYHKTMIPSLGRFINLRFRYRSKGRFKIQDFCLTYKEH